MGVRQQTFHSRVRPARPVRAVPQRPNRAVHEQLHRREDLLKMHPAANAIARLKHHGRRIVVRERYQRPEVKDLGTKWKAQLLGLQRQAEEQALQGLGQNQGAF